MFIPVLGLFACQNRETDIGLDLRSDGGAFATKTITDFEFLAYTVNEDSFGTDSLSAFALGQLNDPEFGISRASIATQLVLSEFNFTFGASPDIDSVVLALKYATGSPIYGPNDDQEIRIYKLANPLESDQKYFSNTPYQKGSQIGSWNGVFNNRDSVVIIEQNTTYVDPAQIRIRLNNSFATELTEAPSSAFTTNEAFINYLNGIVIESASVSGEGALTTIDLNSPFTRLVVYYNDSLLRSFEMSAPAKKYNSYEQNNLSPDLQDQLNNPNVHYNKTFVQSLGGSKLKIDIPNLLGFVPEDRDILINQAELRLSPMSSTVNDNYDLPGRLNLFQPHPTDGRNQVILDYLDFLDPGIDFPVYGGVYNRDEMSYTFRFNRHLQDMIRRSKDGASNVNRGFYITVPADFPLYPGRVIFNTDTSANAGISLKVVYTELN